MTLQSGYNPTDLLDFTHLAQMFALALNHHPSGFHLGRGGGEASPAPPPPPRKGEKEMGVRWRSIILCYLGTKIPL